LDSASGGEAGSPLDRLEISGIALDRGPVNDGRKVVQRRAALPLAFTRPRLVWPIWPRDIANLDRALVEAIMIADPSLQTPAYRSRSPKIDDQLRASQNLDSVSVNRRTLISQKSGQIDEVVLGSLVAIRGD